MAFNPFPAQVSPVEITDLPEKVSPVGNDEIQIVDSENSNAAKKIKISSLPSGSGGGATSLDQLTDVTATSPANGQALVYNNSSLQWEPQTISSNLDSLTDVVITSPVSTQVLKYSGVSWGNGTLTKSNVGLANVDNTSDLSKPISTATQTALDLKYNTSNPSSYVNAAGASAAAPVQSVASRTGAVVLTKSDVGLSNVDNTSDANKPINTATQTALNLKVNSSIIGQTNGVASLDGTGKVPAAQLPSYVDDVLEYANLAGLPVTGETGKIYITLDTNKCYRWSGSAYIEVSAGGGTITSVNGQTGVVVLTKSDVGLANVDNTSDASKPVSTATQTALDAKQNTLVSTTNIKTINGSSILGSGDLTITAETYSVALISVLDINWTSAGILYKDISANSTFTFSNVTEGKAISVILTNTSASSVVITFPTGIYKELGTISIAASSAAIFSFVRANSKTYLASLKDLTNL